MTVKDRIKKTVSNIDPDGVKKFAEVSQDTIEKAQGLSQRVKREQQQVESEEADLNSTENEVEDDLRAEEDEITEGEQEGNPAEIEDAEKKMEQILDLLKKEERETDHIEKKLEDELKTEADEINIEERMESTAERDFKQAAQELEDVLSKLKKYQDSKGKIKQSLFRETEDALQEIRYSAELFRRVLKLENDLIRQLEETKEEEMNLENLVNRIENELGIDKKEIKQLIRDSEKLQIKKDVEEAKKEGQELSQLLQHVQDEEAEVRDLETELQNEVEELGKMIGEDEKILDEMRACRNLLEELEEVMGKEKKGLLSFGGNSRQAKKVLKDIDKTDQVLKKMLNEDRDFIEALEKNYDKLVGKSTSFGRSTLTSRTTWLIIGAIIFVILAIGLYQGNT